METLVVLAQHRNHYIRGGKSQISDGVSPSRVFRGINCRTSVAAVAGGGILPPPSVGSPTCISPHVLKRSPHYSSEPPKQQTRWSSPIPITPKPMTTAKFSSSGDELSDSERWAGPAYSNSPPPSSLPIPKFSLRQKRSVSLELTHDDIGVKLQQGARSAPASPTRESHSSAGDFFFSVDFATENLRRILHLDSVAD